MASAQDARVEQLRASTKQCKTCQVEKLGTEFTIEKPTERPRLQSDCKKCRAAKNLAVRANTPGYKDKLTQQSLEKHRERQAQSLETAVNSGKEWSGADLEIALRSDLTALEAGLMIGRTVQSVKWQRHMHKKDPRKQVLAGVDRTDL